MKQINKKPCKPLENRRLLNKCLISAPVGGAWLCRALTLGTLDLIGDSCSHLLRRPTSSGWTHINPWTAECLSAGRNGERGSWRTCSECDHSEWIMVTYSRVLVYPFTVVCNNKLHSDTIYLRPTHASDFSANLLHEMYPFLWIHYSAATLRARQTPLWLVLLSRL